MNMKKVKSILKLALFTVFLTCAISQSHALTVNMYLGAGESVLGRNGGAVVSSSRTVGKSGTFFGTSGRSGRSSAIQLGYLGHNVQFDLTQLAAESESIIAARSCAYFGNVMFSCAGVSKPSKTGSEEGGSGQQDGGLDDQIILTTNTSPVPVPVPAALWLFGSAIIGLFGASRRKV